MRNFYSATLIMGALFTCILFTGNSSGPANNNNYFTGAPSSTGTGTENTCSVCHSSGAGTFGEPLVEWTISETAGGPNISAYLPGQTYFVTVAVSAPAATTSPAAYGFSSVFLDGTTAPDGPTAQLAGTFSNLDANTQASMGNSGRMYIEHNQRTPSGVWTFNWTAPAAGFGDVNIYSVGNAVNTNFSTSGDSGSSSSTVITLQEDNTLPVTLAQFTATVEKNTVSLDWLTASEINTTHFELERSADGEQFNFLTEIRAKGAANTPATYTLTDENVPAGDHFYRLRMVDADGTFAYSSVVSATVAGTPVVRFFPNPTADRLTITPPNEGSANIRLLDANGRVLRPRLQAGDHDVSQLAPGIYFLEVIVAGNRSVQQLVKQ